MEVDYFCFKSPATPTHKNVFFFKSRETTILQFKQISFKIDQSNLNIQKKS